MCRRAAAWNQLSRQLMCDSVQSADGVEQPPPPKTVHPTPLLLWPLFGFQVRLRLTGVHSGWSGALRFGFTSLDPNELVATDIPKYACPDLVTRPGYWAKALPERLALKDNVLSFWADRHGRVFYSINDGDPILFHCGLSIGCPLWAIVDIYGITQEVTLLGEPSCRSRRTRRLRRKTKKRRSWGGK